MAKRAKTPADNSKKIINMILVYGTILLVVLGIVWLVYNSYVPIPDGAVNKPVDSVVTYDYVKGNTAGSVVVVEYSDFQCPACKSYAVVLDQILDEMGNDVVVVYRHFPLRSIHAHAELAAQAAEAAGNQDSFWEMHDLLFERQNDWSNNPRARQLFVDYAEELGLDVTLFKRDLGSKNIKGIVRGDALDATRLGLSSTPSIFINGELIDNPSGYEAFKQLISESLPATESANAVEE